VHSSDVFVSPTLRRASKRREEVSTQLLWLSDAPLCEGHGEADQTLHHRGTARRDSDCGLHAEFGGKGRSELLCDNLVLRPAGSAPSPLGWYISIVKSSGATCASLTSRRKCDDSARSTSLESLVTDVPFGRSIRTGGISPSARGGATKAARHANISGKSFTLFALTTLSGSPSIIAHTRSPKKYTGRSMYESHKEMKTTSGEWDAFMDDLQHTLDKFRVLRRSRPS
jgi:hypothetical protein